MKLLLVVGTANDVFIYNMAKWLKKEMKDITIDIFSFNINSSQNFDEEYYDKVVYPRSSWMYKIPGFRRLAHEYHKAHELDKFLRDKNYDIIHCHWIIPPVVLSKELRIHCKKLYITFWGGELETGSIAFSKMLYRYHLKKLFHKVDTIINSNAFVKTLQKYYPNEKSKHRVATLGSNSIDYLYQLMKVSTKNESKRKWDIPTDKHSVLIGYSGKRIHQHLKIIEYFVKKPYLREYIHLLVPMTRGASEEYTNQVNQSLEDSGYSYTLIKDRFLSDDEVAEIRYATDVVLQLSDFDGFSRSLIECFTAKSVVIYGGWLDYRQSLLDFGYTAYKVHTFEAAFDVLDDYIKSPEKFNKECINNDKPGLMFSWSNCIKGWIDIYNSADSASVNSIC